MVKKKKVIEVPVVANVRQDDTDLKPLNAYSVERCEDGWRISKWLVVDGKAILAEEGPADLKIIILARLQHIFLNEMGVRDI